MEPVGFAYLAGGLGAGLVTIGAGLGIGKLAAAAMTARRVSLRSRAIFGRP